LKLGEDEVKPEGAAGRCRTRQRAGLQRAQQIHKRIAVPKLNQTPVRARARGLVKRVQPEKRGTRACSECYLPRPEACQRPRKIKK